MTDTLTTNDIRRYATLGHADHGWLNARHHFSFAGYHDPARMGWGAIRVWNDDIIAPQSGFPAHPHADMEIITFVRDGAITHRDSLGNEGRTKAGDVQVMSAGTGIRHSEYNLEDAATRIFQIWIMPDTGGDTPQWGSRPFPKSDRSGAWQVLASGMGDADALPIRAQARVLGATVKAGDSIDYVIGDGRHAYLVPSSGRVMIDGDIVETGDGVALRGGLLRLTAIEDAELILVDAR
jgi:quercetin 2,3-dioxygenase